MPEDAIDVLFRKHDSLDRRLNRHEGEFQVVVSRLDRMETDMQAAQEARSRDHGEVMAALKAVQTDVSELGQRYYYQQGAKDAKRWLVPVIVSVLGVAVAALSIAVTFKGQI